MAKITQLAANLTKPIIKQRGSHQLSARQIGRLAESSEFNMQEIAQFAQSDLAEGMAPSDFALALEDRGWIKLGATLDGDAPWLQRRLGVLKARMYWLLDPHASAAIRTWTNYTLGSGMTFKAQDAGLQAQLQAFWDEPKNRFMTSAEGQRRLNRRLLVDGEIFFAIFNTAGGGTDPDNDGDVDPTILIRKVDCTQITELITDPEDQESVWAYRRVYSLPNGERRNLYYRDWANQDADLSLARDSDNNTIEPEQDVVMYHLGFDVIHQRGNSLFSSALPWMQALRQFMEDRIAITAGLAKIIRKVTFKGGKAQATKVATAMQQQGTTPTGQAYVPPIPVRQAAQTIMNNDAVTIDDMPRQTGAGDARQDFKNLRLMICGGVGMTEPYFGDAESGNLATATAMELPMLKQFESHQQLIGDAWRDIFGIVANFTDPERVEVDVDFPPIINKDVLTTVQGIAAAVLAFPSLAQPEVLSMTLTVLGVNNVDDVMERVLVQFKQDQDMRDQMQQATLKQAQNPQPTAAPGKPPGKPRPVAESVDFSDDAHFATLLKQLGQALEADNDGDTGTV